MRGLPCWVECLPYAARASRGSAINEGKYVEMRKPVGECDAGRVKRGVTDRTVRHPPVLSAVRWAPMFGCRSPPIVGQPVGSADGST